MKQGRTIQAVAEELQRQLATKRDFKAPSNKICIEIQPMPSEPRISIEGVPGQFGVTPYAHGQIASWANIPKKYYDLMAQKAPALLCENVNHWLRQQSQPRMLRTLDGNVRAFLSHRFRPLDNWDVATTALPVLARPGMEILSAEVTDSHLYIKATTPRVALEIKKGDVVQAGIVLSNSEIGAGAVKVEPMLYRLVCLNGAIAPEAGMRRYHIGRNGDRELEEAFEVFKSETVQADNRAFFLKLRDVLEAAFDEIRFKKLADAAAGGTQRQITGKVEDAVEAVAEVYSLPVTAAGGILEHLARGGDLTQWGLANAVTRYSQDVENYDHATELERVGGDIMLQDDAGWKKLVN